MREYDMKIIGCTGTISSVNDFIFGVNKFAEKNDVIIQVLDANMVFGKEHVLSAFNHASRALHRGEASTHSISMELLLYAAGERQIKHAISKMGIKEGKGNLAAIFIFNKKRNYDIRKIIDHFIQSFNLKLENKVLNPNSSNLYDFGIEKLAVESVRKDQMFQLVLEQIALVDVIK